ncbi:serum paraoxonase arylesterase [Moniliophthora roreri]|nr:serum paraoxonase arylesterase [Moniliophthora roreri]
MGAGVTVLVLLVAILAGVYQLYVSPILKLLDVFREVQPLNNFKNCKTVPELKACEEIVLHQPSGFLFLACSTPERRVKWLPAGQAFEVDGLIPSEEDYVAVYDPISSQVTRLELEGFPDKRGLFVHGMDVVPSESNPDELFVYLVNHRPPSDGSDAKIVGADSVVEIFKMVLSNRKLTHVATVQDQVIMTPNDIIGYPDGKSFYFTNYFGTKVKTAVVFRELFDPRSSIGYCHTDVGCKIVASNLLASNGITQAPNGTIYVASTTGKALKVFERQEDNSIVLTDVIPCETTLDNLSLDSDGVVWGAGFPKVLAMAHHMEDPSLSSPSVGWKFGINTGPSAFYGEKFKVEKAFEDSGTFISGATTVVHDAAHGLVFIHGISSPWLMVCED